jgi:hypothetical protein
MSLAVIGIISDRFAEVGNRVLESALIEQHEPTLEARLPYLKLAERCAPAEEHG